MPMDTLVVDMVPDAQGLAPFSLKDAPALIERVFSPQKVGVESQKERKAGGGQTLTALGSYWKGRKPLVLVRATVLASLLPATDDPEGDLDLFEMLMRMDHDGLLRRSPNVTADHVWVSKALTKSEKLEHIKASTSIEENDVEADADGDGSDRNAARWLRIDLDRFDEAEAAAKEAGKARLKNAKATAGSEERLAAEEAAKSATALEIKAIDEERSAERRRIMAIRADMMRRAFLAMPFSRQVGICERVEKVEVLQNPDDALYRDIWDSVNARLGTCAWGLSGLVEQLGVARFGHRPVVGDPFSGGGSIPFEAARIGCDVVASDLNPVAAMLTWGALNIIGASGGTRERIVEEQRNVAAAVERDIARWGMEHNARGDRAKAYLYCLEVVDPQTGWLVPMVSSWALSRTRGVVARMIPNYARKRFDIVVGSVASSAEMKAAEIGTVRDGHIVYRLSPIEGGQEQEWRIPIARLRGDGEGAILHDDSRGNRLRQWDLRDVAPREPRWVTDADPVIPGAAAGAWLDGDIWQERLYCIQWLNGAELRAGKARPATHFAAPTPEDLEREAKLLALVGESLPEWQSLGLVPDMAIESGVETARLMRERGWTYWHHLFTPRALLAASIIKRHASTSTALVLASYIDYLSRLCRWDAGHPGSSPQVKNVFSNQALNTNYSFAIKSGYDLQGFWLTEATMSGGVDPTKTTVLTGNVSNLANKISLAIYDPPYADAVHYHEVTEFFIAWLRKNPPPPFDEWKWDSRRPLAIKGKGEKFRLDMVAAFKAMADHMPDNGIQICMFTHQDAGVWADMAQIVWGAGLRVTAAWYVSTETTSELKKGGYVQGTVLMVLRKREGDERGYRDEIVLEVRGAVQRQVELLTGLNQRAKARQRDENPFSDADIQMAGYAAALEALTSYTHIEGMDMTREALRPRVKDEKGIVEEMIALAVQTATELMRPEGIQDGLWERLVPTERFWLKMIGAEANRPVGQPYGKLDDYQNFAKAYRADGWDDLMADNTPNKARLKGASDFKRAMMAGHPFSGGLVRPVLYAINELRAAAENEDDVQTSGDRAISGLRDNLTSWGQQRLQANLIAEWLGRTLIRHRPEEATAARTLAALIRNERLG